MMGWQGRLHHRTGLTAWTRSVSRSSYLRCTTNFWTGSTELEFKPLPTSDLCRLPNLMNSYWLIEHPESRHKRQLPVEMALQYRISWVRLVVLSLHVVCFASLRSQIPELACQHLYDPPLFFTELHVMQTRYSEENSVCLSVRHTRGLWQNGRKICPDLYTIWKKI